uniref:Phosphodiesterase 4D n=1 Tax=Homo sapiens TaxID=9606 RepID=D6R9L4_HUMAN
MKRNTCDLLSRSKSDKK